jgi:uncharacterized protein YbjT (DUF2867 family)
MKVILFGATGMVGQAVLRECLLDPGVERVLAITRGPLAQQHPKLEVLVHKDFTDYSAVESKLGGYDACFFCLGISSVGMNEADYTRITYDMPLAVAKVLARISPQLVFVYVSGTGTDSTEQGRTMWARVKGKAENAIAALPFKATYMFRPGVIQPLDGIKSRTRALRVLYVVFAPLFPLLKWLFPRHITNTRKLGRAMLAVTRNGAPGRLLENTDINQLG